MVGIHSNFVIEGICVQPVNDASTVQVVKCLNNATCVESSCFVVKVALVPVEKMVMMMIMMMIMMILSLWKIGNCQE